MLENHRPLSDVAQRGQALYEAQIREKVEAEHRGKFLVLNVETGDYEIDSLDIRALKRARAKYPDTSFYILRIGYPAAYKLGGGFRIQKP